MRPVDNDATRHWDQGMDDARVHAVGGVFFRCADPAATREWYARHLGIRTDDYGSAFTWRRDSAPAQRGFLQWSPFEDDTGYFGSRDQQFLINYRVDDLDGMLARLRADGIEPVTEIEELPFGRFVHIVDNDGRRLELWEPIDEVYDTEIDARTES